ncbi:hypothetical protein RQP46_008443 [Phenoliferia psychrophenolica]
MGWDKQRFLPGQDLEAFTCGICQNILRDPIDIGCANEHLFCLECATPYSEETCPLSECRAECEFRISLVGSGAAIKHRAQPVAIGIDLGVLACRAGIWRSDRFEVIPNERGLRSTPLMVGFTDQADLNSRQTIIGVRNFLGRKSSEIIDAPSWLFKVASQRNKPVFEVVVNGKTEFFTPEQITSLVLLKVKDNAETFLGCTITQAVITVPAYFNHAQREATTNAAVKAGFEVLEILDVPVAAVLAYGLDGKTKEKRNILVFSLESGNSTASVVCSKDGTIDVKATTQGTAPFGDSDISECGSYQMMVSYR